MNKKELLELLDTLKIDKKEFWILSSSSLVLRDIYPAAGDLDIAVTPKGLNQLKNNYNLKYKARGWYDVTDKIECICDGNIEDLEYPVEVLDNGYQLQNIQEYYNYLLSSSREKDKLRIPLVEDYIQNNSRKI